MSERDFIMHDNNLLEGSIVPTQISPFLSSLNLGKNPFSHLYVSPLRSTISISQSYSIR